MLSFLKTIFTWWHGATAGTILMTWVSGRLVGKDDQGNRYYEQKALPKGAKQRRRWVVYNGLAEASRVPPEWHAWLHHIVADPPTVAPPKRQAWEKEHLANRTGTTEAHRPSGSLNRAGTRRAGGDYQAWRPSDGNGTGDTQEKTGTDR